MHLWRSLDGRSLWSRKRQASRRSSHHAEWRSDSHTRHNWNRTNQLVISFEQLVIGLASDDVTKLSNAWQRGKLVLNKDSAPYKGMLGGKSLPGRSSLFLLGEIGTVLTAPSRLSASHFKRSRRSDKCGAVFRSIDDLPACFCVERYLCLEPILPVARL